MKVERVDLNALGHAALKPAHWVKPLHLKGIVPTPTESRTGVHDPVHDMLPLLLHHDNITMAVLATITILLLTVLVAIDSVDSGGKG